MVLFVAFIPLTSSLQYIPVQIANAETRGNLRPWMMYTEEGECWPLMAKVCGRNKRYIKFASDWNDFVVAKGLRNGDACLFHKIVDKDRTLAVKLFRN